MAFDPSTAQEDYSSLDTPLSSNEEEQFKLWKDKYAPKDSGEDYDLRGAFKAGLTPDSETGHWPDTYKKPNHPTFSDQSKFAKDYPDKAGSWNKEEFISAGSFDPSSAVEFVPEDKPKDIGDFRTRVSKGLTEANTLTHGDYTPEKDLVDSWQEDFKTTKDFITGNYDYSKINPVEIALHMPKKTLHEFGAVANAFVAAPWAVGNAGVDLLLKQSPSSARKIYEEAFKDATFIDPESHGVKVAFDLIGKTINKARYTTLFTIIYLVKI